MLNFAFPYKDAQVKEQFSALSELLAEALRAKNSSEFSVKLKAYIGARRAFQQMLSPGDYRYFRFSFGRKA